MTAFSPGGPSSRIDPETGEVIIASPCSWAEPGRRLRLVASAQHFGLSFEDWRKRLPEPGGKTTPEQDAWLAGLREVEIATKGLVQAYVFRPSDYPEVVELLTGRRLST